MVGRAQCLPGLAKRLTRIEAATSALICCMEDAIALITMLLPGTTVIRDSCPPVPADRDGGTGAGPVAAQDALSV